MVYQWTTDLLNQLPDFIRARGPYLYTRQGERYLDLWLGGGFALMGHRSKRLSQALKNSISTGLLGDLPSIHISRLTKILKKDFPEYSYSKIFHSWEQAKKQISLQLDNKDFTIEDPLYTDHETYVGLWRPFAPEFKKTPEIIIPIIPFQMGGGPLIVLFKNKLKTAETKNYCSPVLLEGILRSYYDLKKYTPPDLTNELQHLKNWKYKNYYLIPNYSEKKYRQIFESFLSEKIIISPNCKCPSFLSTEISHGNKQKLIKLLES